MNKKNTVIIEVNGGVADVTYCPEGIDVVIVDHDNLDEGYSDYCPNCGEIIENLEKHDGICPNCGFDTNNPTNLLN